MTDPTRSDHTALIARVSDAKSSVYKGQPVGAPALIGLLRDVRAALQAADKPIAAAVDRAEAEHAYAVSARIELGEAIDRAANARAETLEDAAKLLDSNGQFVAAQMIRTIAQKEGN